MTNLYPDVGRRRKPPRRCRPAILVALALGVCVVGGGVWWRQGGSGAMRKCWERLVFDLRLESTGKEIIKRLVSKDQGDRERAVMDAWLVADKYGKVDRQLIRALKIATHDSKNALVRTEAVLTLARCKGDEAYENKLKELIEDTESGWCRMVLYQHMGSLARRHPKYAPWLARGLLEKDEFAQKSACWHLDKLTADGVEILRRTTEQSTGTVFAACVAGLMFLGEIQTPASVETQESSGLSTGMKRDTKSDIQGLDNGVASVGDKPPAAAVGVEEQLDSLFDQAKSAIAHGDLERAHFFLARYMGKTLVEEKTERSVKDLYPLFTEMDLRPTSFMSRYYSRDFIHWFITHPSVYWVTEPLGDRGNAFKLVSSEDGHMHATVFGHPFIEGWLIQIDKQRHVAPIALISRARAPRLVVRELADGGTREVRELDIPCDGPVQCVWPPGFHDLDEDGISELWVRYNQGWFNGFSQHLLIYRLVPGSIALVTNFSGLCEGIARRLPDGKVEVATGYSERPAGHLEYDRHCIETFGYDHSERRFVKVAERSIPHMLWSDDWIQYYDGLSEEE